MRKKARDVRSGTNAYNVPEDTTRRGGGVPFDVKITQKYRIIVMNVTIEKSFSHVTLIPTLGWTINNTHQHFELPQTYNNNMKNSGL